MFTDEDYYHGLLSVNVWPAASASLRRKGYARFNIPWDEVLGFESDDHGKQKPLRGQAAIERMIERENKSYKDTYGSTHRISRSNAKRKWLSLEDCVWLRHSRQQAQWTIEDVAGFLMISPKRVKKIEKGGQQTISLDLWEDWNSIPW
jgi:hypothetical protein